MPDSDNIYAFKMSSPYSRRPHEGSAIHRLEKFHAVIKIEAFVEWPKSDLQQLLDDIEWNTPTPATIKCFRLAVTEWLQGSLHAITLDLIDYLVWKKLYIR